MNNNAFAAFLQEKQMSEEFEMWQCHLEHEEERAHCEQEVLEL